jgi:hypothetical protein
MYVCVCLFVCVCVYNYVLQAYVYGMSFNVSGMSLVVEILE